jgi:hypothetical protein
MDKIAGKWNDVFRIMCSVNFHPHPPPNNIWQLLVAWQKYSNVSELRTEPCFVKQVE